MALMASVEGGCVSKCRVSHIKWTVEDFASLHKSYQVLPPVMVPVDTHVIYMNPRNQPVKKIEKSSEAFISTEFSGHPNSPIKWRLTLEPNLNGATNNGRIRVAMLSEADSDILVECQFSIVGISGEKLTSFPKEAKAAKKMGFDVSWEWKQDPDKWLSNSTLTILCEMTITELILVSKHSKTFQLTDNAPPVGNFEVSSGKSKGDVILTSSGRQFVAHKEILATRCPALYDIVEQQLIEDFDSPVEVKESAQVLEELLRFIYMGKVCHLDKLVEGIFKAAVKYKLEYLKIICEQEFASRISHDNAPQMLIFASSESADFLKGHIIDFINAHASHVVKTDGWKRLIQDHPHLLAEVYSKLAQMKS